MCETSCQARTHQTWRHTVLLTLIMIAWIGTSVVAFYRATALTNITTSIKVLSIVNIAIGLSSFPFAIKTVLGLFVCMFLDMRLLRCNGRHLSTESSVHVLHSTRDVEIGSRLPPVVIHLPVYMESLEETLRPTLSSLQLAVDAYINVGGTASILVMDDGMAFLDVDSQDRRRETYDHFHAIHVAREVHGRAGLFKKASNMNYALHLHRPTRESIILIVDSDTRVPEQCILMTIPEFVLDPKVSFVQHATVPFPHQEGGSSFERFLCEFTRQIYWSGILLGVALGDGVPLVGHNVFLRWSAVEDACPLHSPNMFWNEETVSEDFDMSLRLVAKGGIGRYATFCGNGFQEGVSKTLVDEIHKWRKYTRGVCELLFSPRRLYNYALAQHVPWHHKASLGIYVSSYMAMGLSVSFAITEGILSLTSPSFFDSTTFALHALDVTMASCVIFALFGTGAEILFRVRIERVSSQRCTRRKYVGIAIAEIRKVPMFVLFFGCLPMHIASSTLSYVFGLCPTWGSTAKDGEGAARIFRNHSFIVFWPEYLAISVLGIAYISLAFAIKGRMNVYTDWGVVSLVAMHLIGPLVLGF